MSRPVRLTALLAFLSMTLADRPSHGSQMREPSVETGVIAPGSDTASILPLNQWVGIHTPAGTVSESNAPRKLWEDFVLKGYYSVAGVYRVKVERGARYTLYVRGPAYPGKRLVKLSGDNPLSGIPRVEWTSYRPELRLRDQMDLSMRSRLSCDYVVKRKTFEIAHESQHDWLYVTLIANQVAEKYEILVRAPADPDEEVAAVGEMPGCPSAGPSLWGRVAAEPITLVYGPGESPSENNAPIVAEAPDRTERSPQREARVDKIERAEDPSSVDTPVYETEEDPEPESPPTVEPPTFEPPRRQKRSTTLAEYRPGIAVEWDVYDAGAELNATFRATDEFGYYAKVMLVPASAPHGNETETTKYGAAEKYLYQKIEGELTFNAPHDPGTYELRMFDRDGGDEVAAVAFDVWAPEPGLYLNQSRFLAGDKISFAFTALGSFGTYAKVVLMPVSAPHGDENEASRSGEAECYLYKRTEGSEVFISPNEPGQYALRMYDKDGGKEVASTLLTVVNESLPVAELLDVIGFDPVKFMDQLVTMADTNPIIRDEDLATSFAVVPVLTRPLDLARIDPGPRYAYNAVPLNPHSVFAGEQSFQIPFFATESTDTNELFSDFIARHRKVQASFGHDVDLRGAVFEFAKALAGKFDLGEGKADQIRNQIMNSWEFFENVSAEMASSDNPAILDDLVVFGTKVVLDSMSKEELEKITLQFKGVKVNGKDVVPWAETLSNAGGEASAGAYMEALQTAALGAIDTICKKCAIARKGLIVAHEAAKAVQAWVEDDMTRTHFELYLTQPEASLTVSGNYQVRAAARRALTKLREAAGRPSPTDQEVESFIWGKFKEWKEEKEKREKEVETTLLMAKEFYLELKSNDPSLMSVLGKTERARVERFSELFLQIRGDLLRYSGKDPLSRILGGNKTLNKSVFYLVQQYLRYDHNQYGPIFAERLRRFGWIRPVAELDERGQADVRERIRARLNKMGVRKLLALFAYIDLDNRAGIKLDGFLNCLCSFYNPGNIITRYSTKSVKGSESCRDTSLGPCVQDGFGCGRSPLPPADKSVWQSCSSTHGDVVGEILKDVLAHRMQRR